VPKAANHTVRPYATPTNNVLFGQNDFVRGQHDFVCGQRSRSRDRRANGLTGAIVLEKRRNFGAHFFIGDGRKLGQALFGRGGIQRGEAGFYLPPLLWGHGFLSG
jgi:hypothetical protein